MRTQAVLDALKQVEFIDPAEFDQDKGPVCPACGNSEEEGHASYCAIKWAIQLYTEGRIL